VLTPVADRVCVHRSEPLRNVTVVAHDRAGASERMLDLDASFPDLNEHLDVATARGLGQLPAAMFPMRTVAAA
jgi:hypothetical protein